MLEYAPNRGKIAQRKSSPNAMLFVACGHIVAIAVVMSAKMDLPQMIKDPPFVVDSIPTPPPPDPVITPTKPQPRPTQITTIEKTVVPTIKPLDDQPIVDKVASTDPGPPIMIAGTGASRVDFTRILPLSTPAQLITPSRELKPPYPDSKLLNEEEAALQLRLTIDDQGRVVAVNPVGPADPVFLSAARKHLLAHWRYKPEIRDGRAVASSIVITLRFQLDG